MKPVFGADITEDKNNEQMLADRFVGATVSDTCASELDRLSEKTEEVLESAKAPLFLRILGWLSGAGALLCLLLFTTGFEELGIKGVFARFSYIFVLFLILLGAWILLKTVAAKHVEKHLSTPESKNVIASADNAILNAYHELGVPEGAREVDVIIFNYKMKNGAPVLKTELLTGACPNVSLKIYAYDGVLFLATSRERYEFKISDIRSIQTVNKRVVLTDWNKDEEHNEGEYKKYRIRVDDNGNYSVKPYHYLAMVVDGEELGIYFPSYDLPIFEELTGLRATEE